MSVGIRDIALEGKSLDVKRASVSDKQLKAERPVTWRCKTMSQCSQKNTERNLTISHLHIYCLAFFI